jgi:phage terminase large subunit-like protein
VGGLAHGTRGDYFAWWAEHNLVQGADQWAGKPFVLEESWQVPVMNEALAVDEDARPYWRTVVLVVPRKAGKKSMLGAYADFELDNSESEQEILLAAGSDKQAGRLYGACAGFRRVQQGPTVGALWDRAQASGRTQLLQHARSLAARLDRQPRPYRRCAIVLR